MVKFFKTYSEVIFYKARCDLKVENSKAKLGILWWYLEPMLYLLAFYSIKNVIYVGDDGSRILFLLTGIVFWRWFDSTIRRAAASLMTNAPLATQVYMPKLVFPCISMISMFYRFIFLFIVYVAFLIFSQSGLHKSLIYLPVMLIVQFVLIAGVSIFLSAIVPFLPDLQIILNNLLVFLFFCSGIFFDISRLEPATRDIFYLNPMARLIDINRDVIINGVQPDFSGVTYILLFGCFFFLIGLFMHLRFDRRYPKLLVG
jgi:lipopolysaccharide transport system permease protein